MHAKPDLRVFLKWMIAGSGSVITDVIRISVMGIGILELQFRAEKEFGIQFSREARASLLESGNTENPPEGAWTDIRVSDFVRLIENTIRDQHGEIDVDVFGPVQRHLADWLDIPCDMIKPESWLVRDLGME